MLSIWVLIGLLSVATFLSRVIGVEFMAKREMNPTLRLYFSYVPVAIISALVINQIITTTKGQIVISLPVLIGSLVTAIAIKMVKKFIPSVVLGIATGLLARYFGLI